MGWGKEQHPELQPAHSVLQSLELVRQTPQLTGLWQNPQGVDLLIPSENGLLPSSPSPHPLHLELKIDVPQEGVFCPFYGCSR